jgi:hypothetical protein
MAKNWGQLHRLTFSEIADALESMKEGVRRQHPGERTPEVQQEIEKLVDGGMGVLNRLDDKTLSPAERIEIESQIQRTFAEVEEILAKRGSPSDRLLMREILKAEKKKEN